MAMVSRHLDQHSASEQCWQREEFRKTVLIEVCWTHQTQLMQPLTRIAHSLRLCLCLSALACILRPTNILIWATLATVAWLRTGWSQRKVLIREVLLCGSVWSLSFLALYNQLIYKGP